jgi:hypothetical protein
MLMLSTTAIPVPIEDEYGVPTGRTVDVQLSYMREVTVRDGQTYLEDCLLDAWIEAEDLMPLTSYDVEYALAVAQERFLRAPKTFSDEG